MKDSFGSIHYSEVTWSEACDEIVRVRQRVFVIEQHSRSQPLFDSKDEDSFHVIARNDVGEIIASGRITSLGRLGKIAVLISYRCQGIGTNLLEDLVEIGKRQGVSNVSLNAQLDEQHFFKTENFSIAGPVFMKRGVPHQMLAKKLA
jgi:predicted GNAT family N-acyltransferase